MRDELGSEIPIYSFVVFSNSCELKSIKLHRDDSIVIKRDDLYDKVFEIYDSVSEEAISDNVVDIIYNYLYNYTQVDNQIKRKHIDDILSYKS